MDKREREREGPDKWERERQRDRTRKGRKGKLRERRKRGRNKKSELSKKRNEDCQLKAEGIMFRGIMFKGKQGVYSFQINYFYNVTIHLTKQSPYNACSVEPFCFEKSSYCARMEK